MVAVDVNLDGVGVVLVRRLRDERRDVLSSDRPVSTDATGDRCDLGLSICLRIVQDHGGRIEIESQVGRGTTFTIILPVEGAPERKTND